MRTSIVCLIALLAFASCSSPKYTYFFDRHDYNAGKRKKAAEFTNTSQTTAAEKPVYSTLMPVQEEALASTKMVSLPKTIRVSASTSNKKTEYAISKKERKVIRTQVIAAIKAYKKDAKQTFPETTAGGDKNQLVTLLLAIFLGGLGIHRFYLGRTLGAVGQLALFFVGLFTLFPFYILLAWVLLDIILIVMGKLTPKNGSYNPEL